MEFPRKRYSSEEDMAWRQLVSLRGALAMERDVGFEESFTRAAMLPLLLVVMPASAHTHEIPLVFDITHGMTGTSRATEDYSPALDVYGAQIAKGENLRIFRFNPVFPSTKSQ